MAKVKAKVKRPERPKKKPALSRDPVELERIRKKPIRKKRRREGRRWCPDEIEVHRAHWLRGDNGDYHKRAGEDAASIVEWLAVASGNGSRERHKVRDFTRGARNTPEGEPTGPEFIAELARINDDVAIDDATREAQLIAECAKVGITLSFTGDYRPRVKP